jgi:hypothetical protein
MLNPSVADHTKNDNTIRKLLGFTHALGYRTLVVVNVYGLRSTDPKALPKHPDPVGPENQKYVQEACEAADLRVAAWGRHAKPQDVAKVLSLGYDWTALQVNKDGSPAHPLYLPGNLVPQPWSPL